MRAVLTMLGLAALPGVAGAQSDSVVAAFEVFRQTKTAYDEAYTEAIKAYEAETPQNRHRTAEILRDKLAEQKAEVRIARAEFARAFSESNWRKLTSKGNEKLLQQGLLALGTAAIVTDAKLAVECFDRLIADFPESAAAREAREEHLADVFVASGRLGRATAHLRQLVAQASSSTRAKRTLQLGDLLAAFGDYKGARLEYSRVVARGSRREKELADFRLALVGRPAPQIDERIWIGAEPARLSSFRGKVVVLDFFATWCPMCREGIYALDDLAGQHRADELQVIGVTRYYKRGYEAASRRELVAGGLTVENMTDGRFFVHLRTFRERVEATYPFMIAEPQDFASYRILGLPTTVVIDKKGLVRLVALGAKAKLLVRASVDRLLGRIDR